MPFTTISLAQPAPLADIPIVFGRLWMRRSHALRRAITLADFAKPVPLD